ncbi:MAG: hypothetical protein ACRDJ5_00195 [Actinomycetota bacterium]
MARSRGGVTRPQGPITGIAAVLAAALLLGAAPARAASPRVARDRTDNHFSFTYRARGGRVATAVSGTTASRGRVADFFVYVSERAPERVGDGRGSLRALLALRMTPHAPRVLRYRGEFTLTIVDSDGAVVYRASKKRRVVLRDRSGERVRRLFFPFDLPSGDYDAHGSFRRTR